ncbi:MAG: methyltransferase [Bacteroidetes bacterium]|nr:methyltransferase [Bacteroidota bacterium]
MQEISAQWFTRKLRQLSEDDIHKIAQTFESFHEGTLTDEKGFCAIADLETITKQDHILTPGRYVGIADQEEDAEPFEEKMTRLTTDLSELFSKSHELEEEIKVQLKKIGYEI